ncbi:9384_t:CDS:2 [Diversispora eburnea]|uniref:9384_t:CDS:1 n=1 Tax=Diversispora eburnea TaxID=1213867 RepID=A0A9N9FQU0_9GLOM|nr:9384_t:CDS:2 [Diversispora eburnea]
MPKVTKSNNSGSIENPMRKVSDPPPELTLPFPPEINPEELMANTRKLPSKPPNAFFIYRKVYTKALVAKNMRFKMTDVSPWVSSSWKLEPEEVKTKYKEIARNVRQIYKKTKETSSVPSSNYDCKETQTQTQTNSSSSSEQIESPIEKLLTPDLSQEDSLFGQWTNTDFHSPQDDLDFEFPNFSPLQDFYE